MYCYGVNMAYKILSKVYYQSKNEYEDLYNKRKNGENVKFLDIKIHS